MLKNSFAGPLGLNSDRQFFFSKTWLLQSLDIKVSYKNVQYQKKLIIQSWENLVTDGQTHRRTDGQTDRQMDESDLKGRCPTNDERSKIF